MPKVRSRSIGHSLSKQDKLALMIGLETGVKNIGIIQISVGIIRPKLKRERERERESISTAKDSLAKPVVRATAQLSEDGNSEKHYSTNMLTLEVMFF